MSAFILTDAGEAIGWSVWPWDRLYTPAVGAFVSGRLVATAPCGLEKPLDSRTPSMRLRARIGRRLLRTVGVPSSYGAVPVALDGPADWVWFRMALPAEAAERLRRGDPTVRLERLEDGETLTRRFSQGPLAAELPKTDGPASVESLLDVPDGPSPDPLDGFAAFLTTPLWHQLQGVFSEYLKRLPEPGARAAFMPQLESGALNILELRNLVLASDEFRARRVGYGARLGATWTSRAWKPLTQLPTQGPGRRALPRFRIADYDGLPTAAYAAAAFERMAGRAPDPAELAEHVQLSEAHGRRDLAARLSRRAACRGLFLEID